MSKINCSLRAAHFRELVRVLGFAVANIALYHFAIQKLIDTNALQQGMDDGSIQATNPGELAEAIMVLSNVCLLYTS